MKRRVVITGMGALTPVGNNVASTWEGLISGQSGVETITDFDPTPFPTHIAAQVKGFSPEEQFGRREARRMDRYALLALAASEEALADSGLQVTEDNSHRIGVIVGTGIGGIGTLVENSEVLREEGPRRISPFFVPMMLADSAAALIAIQKGLKGPNMAVVNACATGTTVIGEATVTIQRGAAEVMVAGGSECATLPIALGGLNIMGALSKRNDDPHRASRPFDAKRDGFVIGEGAAILVLEELEHALERRARIYAEILGYGNSADAFHITAPSENGSGAARCMQAALDDAGLCPEQIDYINAHGTSTHLNDRSETLAIKTIFGENAYNIPVSSIKSMIGHAMGAAGAIEAIATVLTIREGVIPPTINYEYPDPECDLDYVPNIARKAKVDVALSNSFGFGGHNASIILGRYVPNGVNGHKANGRA